MNIPIGGDSQFFMDLYARYRRDRFSVPADWLVYFEGMEGGRPEAVVADLGPELLDRYRRFGHLEAQLDPLAANTCSHPALATLREKISARAADLCRLRFGGEERSLPLGEAERLVRNAYAGSATLEAEHLVDDAQRAWLNAHFEAAVTAPAARPIVAGALQAVLEADEFESFMRVKFPTKKRFGAEGSESSIAFLMQALRSAAGAGIDNVVIGGMHRGRLATLAVALRKNPAVLAGELKGRDFSSNPAFTGDVPYHLGYSTELAFGEKGLKVDLMPHPSHLMVVAPVALGYGRAVARNASALPLLMHTDAAFAGQGVTMELMQLGGLKGYGNGGTIHLVVNNRIGFTTLPSEGRTSRYCTDVAKAVEAPVLHVNGDDPVTVGKVAALAVAWRNAFGRDVVIDLVCYRRYGHNELDEPRFTQPLMWNAIDTHPPLRQAITARAADEFPAELAEAEQAAALFRETLREGFETADSVMPNDPLIQDQAWAGFAIRHEEQLLAPVMTGLDVERLRQVGIAISTLPDDMKANVKVERFHAQRAETIRTGEGINFATAEALAFATLVAEGRSVRLSGQDAVRGTFTQRHLAVHDAATGRTCKPIEQAAVRPGQIEIVNSPLSEYGVLGFEYGHSLVDPQALVVWEAQFGDFLNGAQIVVDQYIVSAEAKWQLRSGLVIALPHGLEGQGPDHSSARIERIAQLYASGNLVIAQPTTPASLFHLLRRQVLAPWRKPLFLIAPKAMLRMRAATSALTEIGEGTGFRPVLADPPTASERVRRVILCSGKVAYALEEAREVACLQDAVALVRIEQIAPFPEAAVRAALAGLGGAEMVWCQEEPGNQGAWPFLSQHLKAIADVRLIARPATSVSAGGSIERHEREQAQLMARAMDL
ncbi:2-oxoglutarate dehydrogenase E1 component [Pseudorhizobium flavum]|uniref:2-oxoglutarate dehydrogenase E1 component n=1 Tax=Pseudorhizobium flavum TaxID=1335061 RepID=A0A7X0DFA6_9HYPH|nr:2-oxoglutarate dehydrogenase E1 component [Pseudorhizobium flavum]MBB6181941.1 2-oxoglutarate dehydrogenase E1 component [Pseudorhizobium flavum]CAD6628715.1 2-oxoglutarate dehydrogenase E1 component [Pseudorhizobium flavum]